MELENVFECDSTMTSRLRLGTISPGAVAKFY